MVLYEQNMSSILKQFKYPQVILAIHICNATMASLQIVLFYLSVCFLKKLNKHLFKYLEPKNEIISLMGTGLEDIKPEGTCMLRNQ